MVVLKRKVAGAQVEVQAQDFKGICTADDLLGRLPDACTECGGTDLHFYHKTPKDAEYFGVRCRKCSAEQAFHQKKAGGFYIKWDDKFQKFDGSKSGNQQEKSPEQMTAETFESDVPF